MALVRIICANCYRAADKEAGGVNRSIRIGAPIYCGRDCAGIGRRNGKSSEQLKEEKRIYDDQYRQRNLSLIKSKKHAYFERTYDPVKASEERQKRMPQHVEYCRRPEYRKKKKTYDRAYRAEKDYGEYWECQVLTLQIREEALSQMSDYEIRQANGTFNKAQQRKRYYERAFCQEPEVGPLGDLEFGERR